MKENQFSALGLSSELCQAVSALGYTTPTPIQTQAIPHLLAGRDLLGVAQTGTGKTAAFALPILHRLQYQTGPKVRGIRVLILTPTRELAQQIFDNFKDYGKGLPLTPVVIYGGVGMEPQKRALSRSPEIVVATPGRYLDLKQQGCIDLRHLNVLVLDEADRMLDMGFIHDVKRIIRDLPAERQNIMFSATMPDEIGDLSGRILRQPVRVEVTPVSSANERIEQKVYYVEKDHKRQLLLQAVQDNKVTRCLVFSRTKGNANRLARFLQSSGVSADAIHGDKSQSARLRALAHFKSGQIRVLVASDIAARGIDIDDISHVVNYDIPEVAETYVHRIGRTGRAEGRGIALSFCSAEERGYLKKIERLIKKNLTVLDAAAPRGR